MATEFALLTALPNGIRDDGGAVGLTVFVSPRLSTDGEPFLPLADFPAFSAWPDALADVQFAVEVEGVGLLATDVDPDAAPPDPGTWKLVFGGDVGVVTGTFTDLSEHKVNSYPAAAVDDFVTGLYADIATSSPTAFPPVTTGPLAGLADELGDLGDLRDRHYRLLDELFQAELSPADERKRGRYLPPHAIPAGQQRRFAFLQAYRFYDRGNREPPGPIDADNVPPPPKPPQIDFHGYVASLGDYPLLLRPLGLAIDLVATLDAAVKPDGRVRVHVDAAPGLAWAGQETARPWTNYELDDRRFVARPRRRESEIVDGMLRLEGERFFHVHQLDVDGSALKTVDFAATVARVKQHLGGKTRSMTDDAAALPALRGGGFTVSQHDRAMHLVGQFDEAALHQDALDHDQPANLFAEDVTRGFRVDVEPNGTTFHPLCARTGSYVVETPAGPEPIDLPPDEGYATTASTTSVPDDDAELYLHEAVFSWGGWSLVAERPGQRLLPDETIDDGTSADPVDTGVPLRTAFRPTPGTLPRLRYGSAYRFRARLVDLAGNSVTGDAIEPSHATEASMFRRWEPVPSPAVVPRRPFGEGESLLRMVIRSTLGVAPADYVDLDRVVGLPGHADPLHAYRAADERWLAPPKTSQQMAEFHGTFDPAIGVDRAQQAIDDGFDVGARESGSFLQTADGQPLPGAFVFNPHGAAPTDLATLQPGAPLQPGEYLCIDSDDLELPYLPDVVGRGVSFTTLPADTPANTPTRVVEWPEGTAWFDRRPIRLRIEAGPDAAPVTPMGAAAKPVYDKAARLLTVHVPQAEVIAVKLASAPHDDDLDVLAVWSLLSPAAQHAQRDDAVAGRHWMLTPSQTLVLVHAVEKPLLSPQVAVTDGGMQRLAGETFCAVVGSIDNHAKSTGRLDVEAEWAEQADDVLRDAPEDGVDGRPLRDGFAHVGDFAIDPDEDDCRVGRNDKPRLGAVPPVHELRHELGDTRHRRVRYHAVATTRFREYFPPEVIDGVDAHTGERLITHVGPERELSVPSSRRPEPPDIAYIIPTFTWSEEAERGAIRAPVKRSAPRADAPGDIVAALPRTFRRLRQGGGLRVYLRRPWFSSGDGELLGVVLRDQPWLTWPIDVHHGLIADAAVKAAADLIATRLFERGVVRPSGTARLSPTERLAAALGGGDDPVAAARTFSVIDAVLNDVIIGVLATGIDPEKLLTRWGADPIWGSPPPAAGPFIHQFPLRAAVGTGLSLAETNKAKVTVVGHRPQFDTARQLWFCDLQVDAGASYFPFIRPALCRYQPRSISGMHISRVVVADYAQLVADRTASLTRHGNSATVTVRGPAGTTHATALFHVAPAGKAAVELSRFVTAQVERRSAGAHPDFGWVAVGPEVRLEADPAAGLGDVRWAGSLPVPPRPASAEQRIAVREYEILESDDEVKDDVLKYGIPFAHEIRRPVRYRLVYADHLAVD